MNVAYFPWNLVLRLVLLVVIAGASAAAQIPPPPDPEGSQDAPQAESSPLTAPRLTMETGAFSSEIRAITFSADNRFIAASSDSDIRIWDIASGELLHTIRGFSSTNSGKITSIAADPQGNYLAIAVETNEGAYLRTCALSDLDHTTGYWGNPAMIVDEALPGISLGYRSARELTFSRDGKYLGFVATTMAVDADNNVGQQSTYLFFDWEQDELVHSSPLSNEGESAVATKLFGAARLPQAGRFLGTDRYYVIPSLQSAFDVETLSTVNYQHNSDLQWMQRLFPRLGAFYAGDANLQGYMDGDLPGKVMAFAYMTKKNGKDVYRCDVWTNEHPKPQVTYSRLPWAPSELKVSQDAQLVGVGDALGGVHVFSVATGEPLLRTQSVVQPLYAASLDQASGVLGLGSRPHAGAAWKINDYADIERGFDLRSRQFVEQPVGRFPRPRTALDAAGVTSRLLAGNAGSYVRVGLPGGQSYDSAPIAKPFFSWNLSSGFDPPERLLFRGGSGFAVADLVQLQDVQTRYGQPQRGFTIAQLSPEKSSVAADINSSADDRFVTIAWTDGSACVYEKSDLQPELMAALPFLAIPVDLQTVRIERLNDPTAAGGLQVGDLIRSIDGKNIITFLQDFSATPRTRPPGTVLDVQGSRNGQALQAEIRMLTSDSQYVMSSGSPCLTFFATRDDDWILFTPEGYYDASLGGHDLIGWKVNRDPDQTASFFTARQLRKSLYRPDLVDAVVEAVLGGTRQANVVAASVSAEKQNPQTLDASPAPVLDLRQSESLSSILPPVVTVSGLPESGETAAETVTIEATAKSQNDLPVGAVVVLINGRPPAGPAARPQRTDDGGIKISQTIQLSPGKNEVSVLATNSAATSTPVVSTVTRQSGQQSDSPKPKLYVLSVGVSDYQNDSYDLRYAAKDAEFFTQALRDQEGPFYREVESKVLTDAAADRSSIQDGMDWLLTNVTQHDLAVIFLSGHGVFDSRRNFYFCSHEVDAERLRSTALAYTEIERLVEELPCKVLLFADTCHSGATRGAKAINQDPWTDLVADEVGAILFASSTPQEESLESDDWGHGAFTFAFLNALREKETDFNADGYISINELDLSLSERVKELTAGRQHPTTQKPSTIRNFNIAVSGTD